MKVTRTGSSRSDRIVASRPVTTFEMPNLDAGTKSHPRALKHVRKLQVAGVAQSYRVRAILCALCVGAKRTRGGHAVEVGGIMIRQDQCEGAVLSRILAQWLIG